MPVSTPLNPTRFLHRLAALAGLLLVAFTVLLGVQTWRAVMADQQAQIDTALHLGERALDRDFRELEAEMAALATDLQPFVELPDAGPRQHAALRRFHARHPELVSLTLLDLQGRMLASAAVDDIAHLALEADDPGYAAFVRSITPATEMAFGHALIGHTTGQWLIPLRGVVRDADARPRQVLAAGLPVELLEAYWRGAPLMERASVGLLNDDLYLLSRFPLATGNAPQAVFGQPHVGALSESLKASGFPVAGYTEGESPVDHAAHGVMFRRLEHFPMTLFVSMPLAEFRAAWWRQSRVPAGSLLLVLFGTFAGYRYTLRRQEDWADERRRADDEQRFVLDHMLAGAVLHGADGAVLACNAEACRLLGLTRDQMLGKALVDPAWHFVNEDGTPMAVEHYPVRRVIDTGRAATDLVVGVVRPGESAPIWLIGNAFPEFDGASRLARMVVTFVDISSRKRAEDTLEQSERAYRLLFENSLDGVLRGLPDGTITGANPAACALLRMTEAEICAAGRTGLILDSDPRIATLLDARRRDGRAQGEVTMRRGDGTQFEAAIFSTVFAGPGNQMLSSVVVRDLTDQRATEAALLAKTRADEANRAKSEFVARMSHELRTPLNAILGFAELLHRDATHPLAPAQREHLLHLRSAGDHLLRLINDLLDLSRIEAGALKVHIEEVDLHETVRQAMREVAPMAEADAVSLHVVAPPAPFGPVQADQTRVRQVVLNLLSNAIKYNRTGGDVTIRIEPHDDRVQLRVQDTGLGLSPEQLASLYQPFNRLGRENSGVEGTGIGLVITRSLVEMMGGTLAVASQAGLGSEFVVDFLRVAPVPAGNDEALTSTGPGRGALRGRVLYIDDDDVNRLLMKAFLDMHSGLTLKLAADGPQGLAIAEQFRPDVVLIDLMMPGMSGMDVLAVLRGRDRREPRPRLVAVSANAMPEEIAGALAAGFDAYLTKPLSATTLLDELARSLGPPVAG